MDEQFFIASYIAHVRQENLSSAMMSIAETPFAEVPATDEMSKLVVVIDAPTEGELLDTAENIRGYEGVLSFLPVYQHAE